MSYVSFKKAILPIALALMFVLTACSVNVSTSLPTLSPAGLTATEMVEAAKENATEATATEKVARTETAIIERALTKAAQLNPPLTQTLTPEPTNTPTRTPTSTFTVTPTVTGTPPTTTPTMRGDQCPRVDDNVYDVQLDYMPVEQIVIVTSTNCRIFHPGGEEEYGTYLGVVDNRERWQFIGLEVEQAHGTVPGIGVKSKYISDKDGCWVINEALGYTYLQCKLMPTETPVPSATPTTTRTPTAAPTVTPTATP